jgi:hypothetical protein
MSDETTCSDQECAERHCAVCPSRKRHHVAFGTVVCPSCVGKARGHLKAIEHLACDLPRRSHRAWRQLPGRQPQRTSRDPEAFMHMRASIARGRVAGPMPEEDQHHPLAVLGRWILFVGEDYGDYWPNDKPLTVSGAVDWLDKRLTRIAHDLGANGQPVHDFDGFLLELSVCRRHVEDVLHDGERQERGVPCPECPTVRSRAWCSSTTSTTAPEPTTGGAAHASRRTGGARATTGSGSVHDYRQHASQAHCRQMLSQYRIPEGTLRRWANEKPPMVRKRGFDGSSASSTTWPMRSRRVMRTWRMRARRARVRYRER